MPVSIQMRSEMPSTLTTSRPWEFLRLTIEDGVALVTLYRPPTNALIGPMIDEIVQVFDAFTDDAAVRAVVVTGGVRNSFSSGGDLAALFGDTIRAAGETARRELFERMQGAFEYIEAFPKPTVAAINGVAIGAGLELALVCDLRVASELAYFALPELRHGIIPGLGGTQRLVRIVGLGRAKELLMVGRRLRAEDALGWGLVHRLAPHHATVAVARALAAELGAKSLTAFAALKRTIQSGLVGSAAGLRYETDEFTALLTRRLANGAGDERP
jgi:enoyl-CoA hydratase